MEIVCGEISEKSRRYSTSLLRASINSIFASKIFSIFSRSPASTASWISLVEALPIPVRAMNVKNYVSADPRGQQTLLEIGEKSLFLMDFCQRREKAQRVTARVAGAAERPPVSLPPLSFCTFSQEHD